MMPAMLLAGLAGMVGGFPECAAPKGARLMRVFTTLALALILVLMAGCSGTVPTVPQVFGAMDADAQAATQPLPLGPRPQAQLAHSGDAQYLCFAEAQAHALMRRTLAGEANTRIAGELAGQVDALHTERQALIAAGTACESHDAVLAGALDDAQNELFWHRVLIGGLVLVLIL